MYIGNIVKTAIALTAGVAGLIATGICINKSSEKRAEEVRENKRRFMNMINKAAEESKSDSESHN